MARIRTISPFEGPVDSMRFRFPCEPSARHPAFNEYGPIGGRTSKPTYDYQGTLENTFTAMAVLSLLSYKALSTTPLLHL